MDKVININEVKEKYKKEIEAKGFERYGIMKATEDLYLYPEFNFVSHTPNLEILFQEELKMEVHELLEDNVIEAINELITMKGQKIIIMLIKEEEENMLTFEIFNMDTNEEFFLSTNMTFNEENRRIFTGLIAGAIDKVDVSVIFLLKLNYNEMASMVK